jgi:hypothetical protein
MVDVDLNFLATAIERLTRDVNTMRDDMAVMLAMIQRMDGTLSGLVEEIRATHRQIARHEHRLVELEKTED